MGPNNVVEMLNNTVKKFPNKAALMWKEDGTYRQITYQQFWDRIQLTALGLMELGINDNDKVAIISNSNPMWGITDFALASIGAVSVPIYPTIPVEQIQHILTNADVTLAVVENEEQLTKMLEASPSTRCIIMKPKASDSKLEGVFTFSKVEAMGNQIDPVQWENEWRKMDRDRLLTIIHTSGTTGKPKGVMLTHGNILANIEAIQFWILELTSDDLSLSYLPLSHIFERLSGHYMPLSVGVTIAYAESIETIPENLIEVRPTILTSVPRLFEKVYAKVTNQINNGSPVKRKIFNWALSVGLERYECYVKAPTHDIIHQTLVPKALNRKMKIADRLVYQKIKKQLGGRMRGLVSGGATLNPEISKFFWSMNIPVVEGYGLTETSPVISTNPMIRTKVGTVGKVLPNLNVRIAEDGEILVKGPSIMKGYYKDQKATEEVFEGEWFKTGDIGFFDEENYLKIIDRKKRILVLSTGKNVAPQPLESSINESSYIEQSVILGEGQKYISCLVNPEFVALKDWAEKNGINASTPEDLSKHPKVIELMNNEVQRYTKSFAQFEQPKKVVVIGDVWSVDTGELTPKMSIKVKVVEEKYKDLIQSIYNDALNPEETKKISEVRG